MVLIDISQVILSNLFSDPGLKPNMINEAMLRHTVLNTLKSYKSKFGSKYGNLVICVDNKHYWRKTIFPFYKANRKKNRTESIFDWKMILDSLEKIKEEIKEYMPYHVMDIDGAEADDVIGVLTKHFKKVEPILIISSDKDFFQLLDNNVSIYRPTSKELWVFEEQ